MLLHSDNHRNGTLGDLDSIHNYYESLVFSEIKQVIAAQSVSNDYIADIACLALNHLPSRYIRHNVDMMFYLSADERAEMDNNVKQAVAKAIEFVDQQGTEQITTTKTNNSL